MKRISGVLLAGIWSLSVVAQEKKFKIEGQLDLQTDQPVMLYRYTIERGKSKDSATVVNGKFSFSGTVGETETGQILVSLPNRSQKGVVFYLEPGTIKIVIPGGNTPAVMSGTPLNNDLKSYREMLHPFIDSLNAIATGGTPLNEFSKEVQATGIVLIKKFVKAHPSSRVSLDLLNRHAIGNNAPGILDSLLHQLKPSLQNSTEGKKLATNIIGMRAAKVGGTAPLFTQLDTAGRKVSLSDFRGKYVLIDFWASWCSPCIAEMPNVVKAYEQYKDKNFTVLGVSLDNPQTKDAWMKAIHASKLPWIQVSDLRSWDNEAAKLYNVNAVPANFLIDPQGKIIAMNLRGPKLAEALQILDK
jgi:peroxiredoxin